MAKSVTVWPQCGSTEPSFFQSSTINPHAGSSLPSCCLDGVLQLSQQLAISVAVASYVYRTTFVT